ncbi:unnamed protein product [Allacma fusca]|uniref:Uncharacterized protein n=1 Tax=Allacma fusca TaxID=39272 RepID=A0A8J2PGD6_9HEXA|nr:unnamed protein product [Allacma fusca]
MEVPNLYALSLEKGQIPFFHCDWRPAPAPRLQQQCYYLQCFNIATTFIIRFGLYKSSETWTGQKMKKGDEKENELIKPTKPPPDVKKENPLQAQAQKTIGNNRLSPVPGSATSRTGPSVQGTASTSAGKINSKSDPLSSVISILNAKKQTDNKANTDKIKPEERRPSKPKSKDEASEISANNSGHNYFIERQNTIMDKKAEKIFVPSMFNLDHETTDGQDLNRRRNCCSKRCKLCFLVGCLFFVVIIVTVSSIALVSMKDMIFQGPSFMPGNSSSNCKPCPVDCQCGRYDWI